MTAALSSDGELIQPGREKDLSQISAVSQSLAACRFYSPLVSAHFVCAVETGDKDLQDTILLENWR